MAERKDLFLIFDGDTCEEITRVALITDCTKSIKSNTKKQKPSFPRLAFLRARVARQPFIYAGIEKKRTKNARFTSETVFFFVYSFSEALFPSSPLFIGLAVRKNGVRFSCVFFCKEWAF